MLAPRSDAPHAAAPAAAAAQGADAGAADEDACAVCFEPVGVPTALPCACKIDYCRRCWDRCLAQSFNTVAQARCPTCRMAVRVDLDSETGRLIFSREAAPAPSMEALAVQMAESAMEQEDDEEEDSRSETVAGGQEEGSGAAAAARASSAAWRAAIERVEMARAQVISRLTQQALPVQTRILQRYGAANPSLLDIAGGPDCVPAEGRQSPLSSAPAAELKRHLVALGGSAEGCLERTDVLDRLREAAGGSWASVASYWASASGCHEAPRCVCGDSLLRVTGRERAERSLEHILASEGGRHAPRFAAYLREYTRDGSAGVICDLCDQTVRLASAVWTCEAGASTIMHATAYDICDSCFTKHVFGEGPGNAAAAGGGEALSTHTTL